MNENFSYYQSRIGKENFLYLTFSAIFGGFGIVTKRGIEIYDDNYIFRTLWVLNCKIIILFPLKHDLVIGAQKTIILLLLLTPYIRANGDGEK